MPTLTMNLSDAELAAVEHAAEKRHMTKNEFARQAVAAASEPEKKRDGRYPLGVLKGKMTYKQAMKLIRG